MLTGLTSLGVAPPPDSVLPCLMLGWTWDGRAAAVAAVVAGLVMLVVIADDARRTMRDETVTLTR